MTAHFGSYPSADDEDAAALGIGYRQGFIEEGRSLYTRAIADADRTGNKQLV